MRFRERQVAVMGDISKMYHRILIPVKDQHVHRFLWREMEIGRDPDVYIKTVLTFGDKPATAMAQIALRKTANENKAEYSKAAEVLEKSTYMDDICESVDTKQEAREITDNIDKVLKTEGFSVKEWICNETLKENVDSTEEKEKFCTKETEKRSWEPCGISKKTSSISELQQTSLS